MNIKALSLRQPWAEAVVRGLKRWETRSWRTHHRGRLLIHAAKHWTGFQVSEWLAWMHNSTLRGRWHPGLTWLDVCGAYEDLDLGCLIGEVDVVDCIPTALIREMIDGDEGMMGNWNVGLWAWKLARPMKYDTPRPCRGCQGLFNVTLRRT